MTTHYFWKSTAAFVTAALAFAHGALADPTNYVSNGSFETYTGSFGNWAYFATGKAATGWTGTTSCGLSKNNNVWITKPVPDGVYALFIQRAGYTYQEVSVPYTGAYTFSFHYCAREKTTLGLLIHTMVDDASAGHVTCASGTWTSQTQTLHLTAGTHRIGFKGDQNGSTADMSGDVDLVSLTYAGTPLAIVGEPVCAGAPVPPYAPSQDIAPGEPLALSMPERVVAEGAVTNILAGWRLESVDARTGLRSLLRSSADAGEAIDLCNYVTTPEDAVFTWLWDVRAPLGVSAPVLVANDDNNLTLSATVSGIGYTASSSATLKFAYGVAPGALAFTNVVSAPVTAAPSSVSTTITKLSPGKVYYVRAVLVSDGEPPRTAVSKVVALQTEPAPEPPAGYAPLEYIATDGSDKPYIDTGYLPTSNTKIAIDMAYLGTDYTGDWVPIWGYRKKANSDAYAMFVKNDATQFALNFKATDTKSTSGVIRGERFIFRNDNARHYVTRLERSEDEICIFPAADQTFAAEAGWTIALFGFRTATGAAASAFDCRQVKMRLYRFKIWEGSTLVRDFVPVRREADSAIGLYDLLGEGGFLANKGTGSLAETVFTAAEVTADNALDSIALSFSAASEARALRVAYGPSNAGIVPANWYATAAVATVAAGETTFSFTPPAEWGDDDHLVLRFYFDGTAPVDWSNAIYWQDYSAPAVTDVALDGTGGDTLVVTGALASFPGDSCALSVYTGDSPATLTNAWTGLAGAVRDATGAFTFTLHEPDTSAARFIAPGETYYVAVQAVADGKVTRTEPVAVTTKAAPTFAAAPTATANRRTVTFTGRLSDLGMTGGTTVRLYVGEPGDAEDDLLAVEAPVTVTDTATSFSITHAFADFEVAHPWQLRAVATSTNGAATAETRSALATVTTKDTTAYTWKSSVTAGDWSDAANWTDNQDGDCLGYPASANATVTFPADTAATVRFTEAPTVGAITIAGNGSVTFTQGGESAAATKLTAASIQLLISTDITKCVTFDGVAFQSQDFFNLYASRSLRIVNGANIYVTKAFANQLTDDVLVADGSIVNCNDLAFSGGTLTISNATIQARNFSYVGNLHAGGHLVFQGTNPKLYTSYKSGCFYAAKTAVQLDFLVPVGGYEAAPIQGPATADYYFANNKGSAGAYSYTVNVLDESPANFVDASVTTPLIWWKKGINKARTLEGDLPAYGQGAVSDDAFSWSTDNANYPTNLLVTINGSSNAGKLQVSGSLGPYGAADLSPAYGYTAVPAEGLDCSAPAVVPLSDVARAVCTGWKLYAVDPATLTRTFLDSGSETAARVAPAASWRELEWQWERQYLVTASAQGPGTVAPASQWIAEGASAIVTATPNVSSLFHSWSESILGGQYATNPLTLAATTNFVLTARFGGDYYVSTQGSDANDGLTPETALLTIGEAVERANRTYGSRITVLSGTYPFPGTQEWTKLTNAVTLASQTGNPDDVIIDCCGGYGLSTEHESARIEGVRIANSYGGAANGHALWINGGSATNIHVCNLTGMKFAAVRVTGGELAGLLFTNNVNNTRDAANGGVILDGNGSCLTTSTFMYNKASAAPVVVASNNCNIDDCAFTTNFYVAYYANQDAGGIWNSANSKSMYVRRSRFVGNKGLSGGIYRSANLSDCTFIDNVGTDQAGCLRSAYATYNADRCVFIGNNGSNDGVITVSDSDAYFRNCLFANNIGNGRSGVVSAGQKMHFINCTMFGNKTLTGSTHAMALSHKDAQVKNCIIYGNGPTSDSRNTSFSNFTPENTCYPEAAEGNTKGNFAANPLFVDTENGDFHLQYGSPCIDAGQELQEVDLVGDVRPQDGNADGVAASDLGCFEMPPNSNPITATLSVTEAGTIAPAAVSLSVSVSGTDLEGLAFTWRAIRDANGTVTTVERTSTAMATADTATYTFTSLEPGVWRFEVVAENGSGNNDTSAAEGSYVVGPDTCYVAPDGGHVWPYDTQAGAATNFCDPASLKPRTIHVAPGEYGPGLPRMTDATIERSWLASIESPTAVIGPDDPTEAVIHCGGNLGFFLGNAESSVSGLMFDRPGIDTQAAAAGVAIRANFGSISNIVVRNASGSTALYLAVAGTSLVDALVEGSA